MGSGVALEVGTALDVGTALGGSNVVVGTCVGLGAACGPTHAPRIKTIASARTSLLGSSIGHFSSEVLLGLAEYGIQKIKFHPGWAG